MVLENFILHITHASENDNMSDEKITLTANELYKMAAEYIEEDHTDGKENPEDDWVSAETRLQFIEKDLEKARTILRREAVDEMELHSSDGTPLFSILTNIEIACDLTNEEVNNWKLEE